jgi:hemoglobin
VGSSFNFEGLPMRESPYQMLGGEAAVERLVKEFYDIVESDPAGASLLAMHNRGHGLAHARQAQFEFLSGFLGGPQLYLERHRHSNVRRMHAHLAIGTAERDAWLTCMDKAVTAVVADSEIRGLLMGHFSRVADVLRTHA